MDGGGEDLGGGSVGFQIPQGDPGEQIQRAVVHVVVGRMRKDQISGAEVAQDAPISGQVSAITPEGSVRRITITPEGGGPPVTVTAEQTRVKIGDAVAENDTVGVDLPMPMLAIPLTAGCRRVRR